MKLNCENVFGKGDFRRASMFAFQNFNVEDTMN